MSLHINIRHLEDHGLRLCDTVSAAELALESRDDLVRFAGAVDYDLAVERLEQAILVQGYVAAALECDCARCLKTFSTIVELQEWTVHLALNGVEAVPVENDCVDLTPFVCEDIFLALPQHPLCSKDCGGLLQELGGGTKPTADSHPGEAKTSTWARLDELNL